MLASHHDREEEFTASQMKSGVHSNGSSLRALTKAGIKCLIRSSSASFHDTMSDFMTVACHVALGRFTRVCKLYLSVYCRFAMPAANLLFIGDEAAHAYFKISSPHYLSI